MSPILARFQWLVLAVALSAPAAALAALPLPAYPGCGTGGECPPDYDPQDEWDLGSGIPDNAGAVPAEQAALGSGIWVDRAWSLTTGRTDVVIAVMDSGIEWGNGDLLDKHWINVGELPPPFGWPQQADGQHRGTHDFDGNGVVNMADFVEDPRITPELGDLPDGEYSTVRDPSDLIAFFSDGVDDDGNGYVDDISGWDFFWNDNNPFDDAQNDGYSHGTAEARLAAGAGDGGGGSVGVCPNCMVMNLRVSDSFVGDVNNFAQALIYAVDNGAAAVQEALGTLNNTQLTRDAVDYAWERGVLVVASAADETAWHHNYPGAGGRTLYVHSIVPDSGEHGENASSYLSFCNCTNYGPRLMLSVSADGASSGATARGGGLLGLLQSAARDAEEAGTLDSPLTANELHQLFTTHVDDVALNPDDSQPSLYPSWEGWDPWFGYGRVNAWRAVQAVYDGEIPPEAEITAPAWWEAVDRNRTPTVEVRGFAAAERAGGAYDWELQVAVGGEARDGDFTTVASGSATGAVDGTLATLDLDALPTQHDAASMRLGQLDTNVSKYLKLHRNLVTLRLRVTDTQGRVGEMRTAFSVQDDPDLMPGMPARVGVSMESSLQLADVDGDEVDDLVFVNSDGWATVTDATLQPKPGWPQPLPLLQEMDPASERNHLVSPGYASGDVTTEQRHAVTASPAIGDLDGDGSPEIVVATLNGALMAWHADGSPVDGWPFWLDLSLVEGMSSPSSANYDYGFFASPALGDLDGDGNTLEVVAGAMDSRVYALRPDGTLLDGFPVELREDFETEDGVRSRGERIVSSPALGDVDGDGSLDIAIGTNQKTTGTYGLGYVLHADGSVADGWPVALFGAYTNALPYVGEGIPGSPTLCDVDGDGMLELGMHTIADTGRILRHDASDFAALSRIASDFGPFSNTDEGAAALIMINSGAWGDLDGDSVPDYVIGSMGFEYANGLLDGGRRYDHDHLLSAWSGVPGGNAGSEKMPFLQGFPQIMEDLQFFMAPALADLDGDGRMEAINGSAGQVLHAFDANGEEPATWPKNTGQWLLGSPAVGDADGDGYLDVWAGTRDGYLWGWRTSSVANSAPRAWTGFRHDPMNTGNCHTELRSYPPLPPLDDGDGCACASMLTGSPRPGSRQATVPGWVLAFYLLAARRRGDRGGSNA